MQGLAADGGLFMPDAWPQVDIEKIKTLDSFIDVAKCIVPLFTKSSFSDDEVLELLDDTWHDFSKENFATIHQLDDTKSILELFHGPTAAFKDFGLQLAAAFFNKSYLLSISIHNELSVFITLVLSVIIASSLSGSLAK